MTRHTVGMLVLLIAAASCSPALAKPTLKGALAGDFQFDPDTGTATFVGGGNLTRMGKVAVYGEFAFLPGDVEGSVEGMGIMVIEAASGDVLVANVLWRIDAEGNGDLEFRWPGEITLGDGRTIVSTGRFVELPFAGLRGTASLPATVDWGDGFRGRIRMTGEIVDPDPLD